MSTPVVDWSRPSGGSIVSHLLRTTKQELLSTVSATSIATTLGQDEVDALEQDALDIICLIRSWRNRLAPISRVPPEVLILIPDFWGKRRGEKAAITLTHVCRAWREMFTSRSSLWTDFDCADAEKTRVYLERSKSSPINLRLDRDDGLFPDDPFLQITPHAIGRLKHLFIGTTPDHLQDITNYLSHPAPLLEDLTILGSTDDAFLNRALPITLFDGDLSSLRDLCLYSVRTKLPWRNMVNLTTFALGYASHPEATIGQLLDFFESAPRLLDVELTFAIPTDSNQNGRLVSLARLRKLVFYGFRPPSFLLDHLLIPAGAKMRSDLDIPGPRIEDHLPRSLGNLKNLSGFTKICFRFGDYFTSVKFAGPNGQVCMGSMCSESDITRSVPQSLALLDTSKTNQLEIIKGDPLSQDLHHAFLPITNLQILILSLCKNVHLLILALSPDPNSTNSIPCPKLKRLVFRTEERFDIETMVVVAAARASRGARLKSVKIINHGELVPGEGVVELLNYTSQVGTRFEVLNQDYGLGDDIPEDSDGDSDEDGDEDSDEDSDRIEEE